MAGLAPSTLQTTVDIVVYARRDGAFSVWDRARNSWLNDPARPSAFHFSNDQVWNGLVVNGQHVCEGLELDWVSWQDGGKPQFAALSQALNVMSSPLETWRFGNPQRLPIHDSRERPTLVLGNQTVPLAMASAGARRVVALAYFLVWASHEHAVASRMRDINSDGRIAILFDQPETHLHPRWQRIVLPSLLQALQGMRGQNSPPPPIFAATHSPVVAASLEPIFDENLDDLIHFSRRNGSLNIDQGGWAIQGDVNNWLASEAFGLEPAL